MNLGCFTSKSCTKKRDARVKLLLCQSKPIAFLPFSWTSMSGDLQRRQHSVATLQQCCNHSKQCRNNVATLWCSKNRRCESSGVRCNISFKATTTMSTTTTKKCLMSKTITFFKTSTTRLLDVKPPDTTSNGGYGHTTKFSFLFVNKVGTPLQEKSPTFDKLSGSK